MINKIDSKASRLNTSIGSFIYAVKPGDGSAREQAASCQKVLGGWANIAKGYATKRYRSNCINWGIIPFEIKDEVNINVDDYLYLPRIRKAIEDGLEVIEGFILSNGKERRIELHLPDMSKEERKILVSGCLMNYYSNDN